MNEYRAAEGCLLCRVRGLRFMVISRQSMPLWYTFDGAQIVTDFSFCAYNWVCSVPKTFYSCKKIFHKISFNSNFMNQTLINYKKREFLFVLEHMNHREKISKDHRLWDITPTPASSIIFFFRKLYRSCIGNIFSVSGAASRGCGTWDGERSFRSNFDTLWEIYIFQACVSLSINFKRGREIEISRVFF